MNPEQLLSQPDSEEYLNHLPAFEDWEAQLVWASYHL